MLHLERHERVREHAERIVDAFRRNVRGDELERVIKEAAIDTQKLATKMAQKRNYPLVLTGIATIRALSLATIDAARKKIDEITEAAVKSADLNVSPEDVRKKLDGIERVAIAPIALANTLIQAHANNMKRNRLLRGVYAITRMKYGRRDLSEHIRRNLQEIMDELHAYMGTHFGKAISQAIIREHMLGEGEKHPVLKFINALAATGEISEKIADMLEDTRIWGLVALAHHGHRASREALSDWARNEYNKLYNMYKNYELTEDFNRRLDRLYTIVKEHNKALNAVDRRELKKLVEELEGAASQL